MKVGRKTSQFDLSAFLNNQTYDSYFYRLKLLAMNMFEWENLPDSVSERFLEKTLFEFGRAVFIKDPEMGYMGLKVTPGDKLNVYNEPTKYVAYGIGYEKIYDADNCVLIRNNYLSIPTSLFIEDFAWRLYLAERTQDVNLNAQKTPVLITCPDNLRQTMINMYMKYDGNEPFIFGFKNFDENSIKVLKTDAPLILEELNTYKQTKWQEALSFLGIGTANTQKTERLNIPETVLANSVSSMSANTMLKTRLEACDLFNKMYGENISVKLRENIRDSVIGLDTNTEKYLEGGEVESI